MDLLEIPAQRARDLGRVAARARELGDQLGPQLADALGALRHVAATRDDVVEQVTRDLAVGPGQDRRGPERLVQLADVEGPAVAQDPPKRSGRDLDRGRARGHDAGQHAEVFTTLTQRRQGGREPGDPRVEVGPKLARVDQLGDVVQGRADHPDVEPARLGLADSHHPTLGQGRVQLGLSGGRELAELVEEERAALGLLEDPGLLVGATEQDRVDAIVGERREVGRDELALATAELVHGSRRDFFAGPGLAAKQQGDIAGREPDEGPLDRAQGRVAGAAGIERLDRLGRQIPLQDLADHPERAPDFEHLAGQQPGHAGDRLALDVRAVAAVEIAQVVLEAERGLDHPQLGVTTADPTERDPNDQLGAFAFVPNFATADPTEANLRDVVQRPDPASLDEVVLARPDIDQPRVPERSAEGGIVGERFLGDRHVELSSEPAYPFAGARC